jgi:ATP/ADP translocase
MSNSPKRKLDPDLYAQLRAEAKAPYRGLRQVVYASFGASGLIGAVIFFAQLLAGREVAAVLPNFALQVGVVALMVWLYRIESRASRKSTETEKLRKKGTIASPSPADSRLDQ